MITAVWSDSLWGLRKTVLATNFEESDRAIAADGMTKSLVSLPPWWVSAPKLCVWVAAWQRSRRCSQNLCRPFLSRERVIYYLIIYAAQFFPYQECNSCNPHSLSEWGCSWHWTRSGDLLASDHSCKVWRRYVSLWMRTCSSTVILFHDAITACNQNWRGGGLPLIGQTKPLMAFNSAFVCAIYML